LEKRAISMRPISVASVEFARLTLTMPVREMTTSDASLGTRMPGTSA
jgi:hypothetical protein